MQFSSTVPRTRESGYTVAFLPIIVPGLSTALQPISAKSPTNAPAFFKPVGIVSSPRFIATGVLSDLTLEVTAPAPR